jgi:hypothetical protein
MLDKMEMDTQFVPQTTLTHKKECCVKLVRLGGQTDSLNVVEKRNISTFTRNHTVFPFSFTL